MLAIRSVQSLPRRFQGRGGMGAPFVRRRLSGLGDDFANLYGTNDTSSSTIYTSGVPSTSVTDLNLSPSSMGVYNLNESNAVSTTAVATVPSASGSSSGPSWASVLAGVLPGLTNIGAVLAKNLTTPFATITSTPYGTTESIPVGGSVSPSNAFSSLGLSSSTLSSMLPLLLIGGALILFSNMSKK